MNQIPPASSDSIVTPPVKMAVVGCGRIAYLHARRLSGNPRVQLVALMDEREQSALALRDEWAHEARVFTSLDRLLDTTDADAVLIATPTQCHFEQTLACLKRGWHVLCEKPLAEARPDIVRLIEAARKSGKQLTVAYQRRYWATCRTLRAEVQSGRYGPVLAVASHNVENWQSMIAGTWRDDPACNPAGFIGDAGSHKIDSAFHITGLLPRSVYAQLDNCASRVPVRGMIAARLEEGVPLSIDFVGNTHYYGDDLHVHCAEGDLMIRQSRLYIARDGALEPLSESVADSNPDQGFLDQLTAGAENLSPPECALPVFDFTHAVLESARTGRTIELPTNE